MRVKFIKPYRFHALPSVAPLKQGVEIRDRKNKSGFHALPSVAPLKHASASKVRKANVGVSTLYRAWPH